MKTNAERLAALKMLAAGVSAAIKVTEEALHAERKDSDRWTTPFGRIVVAYPKPKPYVRDQKAFQAYVQRHLTDGVETVTTTRVVPWAEKQILDRIVQVGDDVLDSVTGEVVEWAGVKTGAPYLSMPKSEAKEKAEGQAIDWALAWLEGDGLRELES